MRFRKLLQHVAKIVQVLSVFVPFVLCLLRPSKRLKKIKIIPKRLKKKIRKFLRSQKSLKKGTLQNYFPPLLLSRVLPQNLHKDCYKTQIVVK